MSECHKAITLRNVLKKRQHLSALCKYCNCQNGTIHSIARRAVQIHRKKDYGLRIMGVQG